MLCKYAWVHCDFSAFVFRLFQFCVPPINRQRQVRGREGKVCRPGNVTSSTACCWELTGPARPILISTISRHQHQGQPHTHSPSHARFEPTSVHEELLWRHCQSYVGYMYIGDAVILLVHSCDCACLRLWLEMLLCFSSQVMVAAVWLWLCCKYCLSLKFFFLVDHMQARSVSLSGVESHHDRQQPVWNEAVKRTFSHHRKVVVHPGTTPTCWLPSQIITHFS